MLHRKPLLSPIVFMIAMIFCLSGLAQSAQAQGVMRIAAVVNDDLISALDLAQRVRLTIALNRMPNTQEVQQRLVRTTLRKMIDERLKVQEATRNGIEVSDEQLNRGIQGWALQKNIDPSKIDQLLTRLQVDRAILEEQAAAEISWLIHLSRNGGSRTAVSDDEITAALAELDANKGKPEYLYSEIFIPVETPAEDAASLRLATRLFRLLQQGSAFNTLASDFSQSPTAQRGGDLGWVQSGQLPSEIEQPLSEMPAGAFSSPIKTLSGYYLVLLRERRIAGSEENDEILNVSQVVIPYNPNSAPDIRFQSENTARTLVAQAQSCNQLTKLGEELGNARAGAINNIRLSKMPEDIRAQVTNLQEGQVTSFIQKNQAILVLMVCSRQQMAATPEVTKRNEMRQRIRTEKLDREDRRIMQRLRRNAFVDIRL